MAPRDYLARSSIAFGDFAVWVHDHRLSVLISTMLTTVLAAWIAAGVGADASLDSFFDPEDPTYKNYYDFRADFGSDEIAYILYTAPTAEHGVFDLNVMRSVAELSRSLEREVPFVKDVSSLSSSEFMQSDGDDILVREILHDFPETQEELLKLRNIILSKDIYINNIVSADGRHAAIILEMSRSATDPTDQIRFDPEGGDGLENLYPQASGAIIREILERPQYSELNFYNVGDVELNAIYNTIAFTEPVKQLTYSVLIIMVLGLVLLRGGLLALLGPLAVVLIALLMTVAAMALLGWDVDLMFSMIPNLLIAIGVAQSVHLLSEFQLARSHGLARRDALRETMELVGNPCLLAALSTAVGFLAMAGSDLKGISHVSIYGAIGVVFTYILTVTLLLSLLSFGGEKARKWKVDHLWLSRGLHWVADINVNRPALVYAASIFLVFAGIAGVAQLRVDFSFLTDFKPHLKIRQDTEYAEQNMGGMLSLVYVFEAGEDGMKSPENLRVVEQFQRFAEQRELVHKSLSIVDTLKDLNRTFHGDNPDYYRLPDDQELIAQYLLLYELSGGDQLEEYLTSDFSRAVVDLRVTMSGSTEIRLLFDELQAYLDEHVGPLEARLRVEPSGVGLLWVRLADYISSSFTQGYLLVFVMIFVLMCVIFRSLKVGSLAMIPNLGPIFLTMGYMGWAGINLDYIRMMIATIAIGIAVDDTVHLVTRMRQEFFRCGNYEEAMRAALSGVGQALVITTIILAVTFATHFGSELAVMASFGSLLISAILTALLADLFLLPVLIVRFKAFGPEFELLAEKS
ncbi:MAG: RND family transporter [Pseudomonadales bacterium]